MDDEKRAYNKQQYSPEQVSHALQVFMSEAGSIHNTQSRLKKEWGYSPTEPTLRKWIRSSDEAIQVFDMNSLRNLQDDIAHVITLTYDLLVQALESGEFPPSKLGTLMGIMVDKWLVVGKVREDKAKDVSKDIVADEMFTEDDPMMKALLGEPSIALNSNGK